MQITTKRTGTVLHAALSGELDHHSAAAVRQALDAAMEDGVRELVLDLSGVSFMDSSGIGVILGRYRILRARGGPHLEDGGDSYLVGRGGEPKGWKEG